MIIYNHGQDDHDKPSKDCVWKNNIRNFASLFHLAGDDWKRLWKKKFDFPYQGITKLDKRVNANLDLEKYQKTKYFWQDNHVVVGQP